MGENVFSQRNMRCLGWIGNGGPDKHERGSFAVRTGINKVHMSEDNFLHELISIIVLWLTTTEAVLGSKAAFKRFWI